MEEEKIERTVIDGIPVDSNTAIDTDRFNKVTSGRRKIPLSLMFRSAGSDLAASSGQDIYIAVVCYDTTIVGSEKVMKVSNLLFSGSAEALVHVSDVEEGPIKIESFNGTCLLILNPSVIGASSLRIPSLKACLKLGSLTGLGNCSHESCNKPVLVDRDGPLCYKHSSQMTMRVQVGGSALSFVEEKPKDQSSRKIDQNISIESKKAHALEKTRLELLAKKKTAMLLLNRSSGSHTHAVMRLSVGDEKMLDIGEMNQDESDQRAKVAKYQAFKRKRESLDRLDEIKQRKENEKKVENFPLQKKEVDVPRKSISERLADVIKSERGF